MSAPNTLLDRLAGFAGLRRAPEPPTEPKYPWKLERDFEILAHEQGLLATIESELPIDSTGAPIPWFTYPAIEYLNQFNVAGKKIFEYGSGNSSLYWLRREAKVWSAEHNEAWFQKAKATASEVHTLYYCLDPESYSHAIERAGVRFDMIVIDGEWRTECAEVAVNHLEEDGFIILDNAERDLEAGVVLRNKGFFEVDFSGFGPINAYTWTTAIFLPRCGASQRGFQPPRPVGGCTPAPLRNAD